MDISNKEHADVPKKKRSFVTTPPTYSPSLLFYHGKYFQNQTFCTLFDQISHVRQVPELRRSLYMASCYGWLLLSNDFLKKCFLFNPVSLSTINLPPLIDETYQDGVLTSDLTNADCFVVTFSQQKKSFAFCKINDTIWTEQALEREKRNSSRTRWGFHVTSCNRKIYVIFRTWIYIIDLYDEKVFPNKSQHQIEYQKYSLPIPDKFSEHIVESCGDIYKVNGFYMEYSEAMAYTFDVFRLDMLKMEWVTVETLGDRIFLLGPISASVSASELGVKGDCLYYTSSGCTNLYRFNVDDGTTTSLPKKFPCWRGPLWVVPNCKPEVIVNNKVVLLEGIKGGSMNEERSSKDLPLEILEMIMSSLFQGDCIRFRLTCKPWLSINPPTRWIDGNTRTKYQKLPWLMSFPKTNKGVCKLNHPIYSDAYYMNIPELADATIREAKHGWLLMSRVDTIFFFHPVTAETINIPKYYTRKIFECISFSNPPTSPDCVVFSLISTFKYRVDVAMYRIGSEEHWDTHFIDTKVPYEFIFSDSNPVYYNDVFYCLSKDGKLGIFDPKEREKSLMWKVLHVPPVISLPNPSNCNPHPMRSFIVECDGDIVSVFVGLVGKSVSVYKLERLQMRWVRLDCLGDKTLFLSHAASKMVSTGLKGIEDRIYFPTFYEEDNVYYSLAKGGYNCFGRKYSRGDWLTTLEHWHCSWIQLDKSFK